MGVDIELTCISPGGIEGTELGPPVAEFTNEPVATPQLSFDCGRCEESKNSQADMTCKDVAKIPAGEEVVITCVRIDGTLEDGKTVSANGRFTMTAVRDSLPTVTMCSIADSAGTTHQTVTFDMSMTDLERLSMKDAFGALEVESVNDTLGESLDCLSALLCECATSNI